MIRFTQGNMLVDDASALVIPVNCVGVMGKGLALAFRKEYPDMFADYKVACARGEIRPGRVWTWPEKTDRGQRLICFPTKDHWREDSFAVYSADGLVSLRSEIQKAEDIESIAVPALGCGLGGLQWTTVKRLIEHVLETVGIDVRVYRPLKVS
jgi:O-acetyl-ADP-ribose deacetylase (regulator of RNase III)